MCVFYEASPKLAHRLGGGLKLRDAVDLVEEADGAAFSPATMQVVQLPPPCGDRPPFLCLFPPGREGRPNNANGGAGGHDPLAPESVKARGQNYFQVKAGSLLLQLLRNPFGYSVRCATWPTVDDIAQSAVARDRGLWSRLIESMLILCGELRGDIVGFNAQAGNSMRRLHCVSHLPVPGLGPYALPAVAAQLGDAARRDVAHLGPRYGYPIDAWRFGIEDPAGCAAQAAGLLARWEQTGGPYATASVAAAMEDGRPVLYVVPRNRLLSPFGWPGMPAVMEVLGVGVSSDPGIVAKVRAGDWGHADYERLLASVRPHGVERLS